MIPGDQYWEEQATTLRRDGLSRLRGQAEKWQTALTALLGVVGAVALFEAPTKLGELPWLTALLLVLVSLVAIALILLAIRDASDVAVGIPDNFISVGGPGLEQWTFEQADSALSKLKASRNKGYAAVTLLVLGFALIWLLSIPWNPTSAPVRVLAITNGTVVCGELTANGDELQLKLASGALIELKNPSALTSTSGCPK